MGGLYFYGKVIGRDLELAKSYLLFAQERGSTKVDDILLQIDQAKNQLNQEDVTGSKFMFNGEFSLN